MLTVKLRNERTQRTRNVECAEVIVDPPAGGHVTLVLKKADGAEESVEVTKLNGADGKPGDFHIAFVENAQGSTIQVVRP